MGRLNQQVNCVPSSCAYNLTTSATYDLAGNITDLYYPDPTRIHVHFNSGSDGRVQSVDGSVPGQFAQSILYNPDGTVRTLTLGNGIQQGIVQNNRLQVRSLSVGDPLATTGGTYLDRTYCYTNCNTGGIANNGNIWGIVDNLSGSRTQGFTYDQLNRISSFSLGGAVNQQYSIDSFGNLSGIVNGQASTIFDPATNRISNLPCAASTTPYDANGNQLCDTDSNGLIRQYMYNAENRVTKLAPAAAPANAFQTFSYNPDGTRVLQTDSQGNATEYVYFGGMALAEKRAGLWTDNVYAGGKLIARVAPSFQAIHTTGVRNVNTQAYGCGTNWWVDGIGGVGYALKSGDRLLWNQKDNLTHGGISFLLDNGSYIGSNADDSMIIFDDTAQNANWHPRAATIPDSFQGRTLQRLVVTAQNDTPQGTWEQWVSDVSIVSTDGTVTPIFTGQALSAQIWGTCGPNENIAVVPQSVGSDASAAMGTHFFLGDQIGTAQMEFTSGGWPVWQGQFGPFGQELDGQLSSSNYKFAGLERNLDPDAVKHTDHATFRELANLQGRWMAADPYDGSMDVNDPQSLNRYSYVGNSPLNLTDPQGLFPIGCGFSTGGGSGAGSAFISWGTEIAGSASLGTATAVGEAIGCAYDLGKLIYDLLKHPAFTASHTPRPSGRIWDEHQAYKVKPFGGVGDLLGLQGGCEFGACGAGSSSFGPGGPGGGSNPLEVTSGAISGGVVLPFFYRVLGPAFSFSYDPKNHLLCAGIGVGLSAGHTAGGGPVVVHAKPGKTSKDVLSGWSISGGYNWTPWWGNQISKGSNGYTAGYSFGVTGASGAVTYSWCRSGGG